MIITPEELEAIRARHERAEEDQDRPMDSWSLAHHLAHKDRATLLPLAERCLKAEARVAELEEALAPFAAMPMRNTWPDHMVVHELGYHSISAGDFRRAAKTLKDT